MNKDCVLKYLCCVFVIVYVNDVAGTGGYTFPPNVVSNLTRIRRQSRCNGFLCTTLEQCISEERRCDGIVDCSDGSDEFNNCKDIRCPGYLFVCDYGACIEAVKKCDGNKDCRDNSDEANCLVTEVTDDHKASNCKSSQFQCKSGQCIDFEHKCDGITQCDDKSDETKETCLNIQCPGYTYKCDYGACVDGFAKCNGVKDCVDNSDELNCGQEATTIIPPTPKPTPSTIPSGGCVLPDHPDHGTWIIHGASNFNPGQRVSTNTLVNFKCDPGYTLNTESPFIACLENSWTAPAPECTKLCPAIYNNEITQVNCFNARKIPISCAEAVDGASLEYQCAPYYEPSDRNTQTRHCVSGHWNLQPPQCIPVCGEKIVTAEILSVGGTPVVRGNYPWVAAVYVKDDAGQFENSCGGTMLNQRVILTAAHCVADDYGKAIPADMVEIAVGKYYNKYKDERDTEAEYSKIQLVLVHRNYRSDAQRHASDIAFLITKTKLSFSKVVQPVCTNGIPFIPLSSGQIGVVAGWGYTTFDGKPSDILLEVPVPYKTEEACARELPPDWSEKYLTYDKFCAGHHNKSIAVCKGDSGSGLVFQNDKDRNRFYVHGIVSLTKSTNGGCDIQLSALYTRVSSHYDWLEQITAKYSV